MDEAEKMVAWLALGIVIVLLFVLSATESQYLHPMPGKECKPYIYPICFRAETPLAVPPASTIAVYLSILLVVLLAIFLTVVSYNACVIEQRVLITGVEAKPLPPPTAQPAQGVDASQVK